MTKINALKRLTKDYDTWLQLCKNKTRASDPGRKREKFAQALSYGILGLQMLLKPYKKTKCCLRKKKKIYTSMKTSEMQEKASSEEKMHYSRKAFQTPRKKSSLNCCPSFQQ